MHGDHSSSSSDGEVFHGCLWKLYNHIFGLASQDLYRFLCTTIPEGCPEFLQFRLLRDSSSTVPVLHLQMEFDQVTQFVRRL